MYASLAREGGNSTFTGKAVTDSGEVKEYYYIKQPASVPERKVSSVPVTSTASLLLPPNRDIAGSQASIASRSLPPIPDASSGALTESQEPTEEYIELVLTASPPVGSQEEAVDSNTEANPELEPSKEESPTNNPPATERHHTNGDVTAQNSHTPVDHQLTCDQVYMNEEVGAQKGHPPIDRQPTYDSVYMNEEIEAKNSHTTVSQQPTYENTESAPSRPVLQHQPTSEELYVVMKR